MDINKKIKATRPQALEPEGNSDPKQPKKKERRKFPRYELACPVALYADIPKAKNAFARSRTDNISDGGCYVTVAQTLDVKPDMTLRLNMKIPRQTPNTYMLEPFQTNAYIVRVEPARDAKSGAAAEKNTKEMGLALQFLNPVDLSLE